MAHLSSPSQASGKRSIDDRVETPSLMANENTVLCVLCFHKSSHSINKKKENTVLERDTMMTIVPRSYEL